jgi:antirestriction protein
MNTIELQSPRETIRAIIDKNAPSVYVGTYAKYNSGSIQGAWVRLDQFSNEDEFFEYCAELHNDEEDPEFMYQDFENFPNEYYSESALSSDLWEWISLDDDEKEMLSAYIDCIGQNATIDEAREAYSGQFDSDIDFVMELLESCGDIPKDLPSYIQIDWEGTARNIMYDYSEANGYYFRNC